MRPRARQCRWLPPNFRSRRVDNPKLQAYFPRPSQTSGLRTNMSPVMNHGYEMSVQLIERLCADRWRTPGSWERSRVGEIDSPHLTRTLPSQLLRRVFYCPKQGSFEISRLESRNGRPGSRGSRRRGVCPSARGLSEGTRRMSRIPMTERTFLEVRNSGASFTRRAQTCFRFGLPYLAAKPTLVVKISDTSLQGKERVRIPPVKSRTVEAASSKVARTLHGSRRLCKV